MPTVKPKWFKITKGFGFIVPDDGGADVYIPMRKVEEASLLDLETGMELAYTIGEGRGRQFAENLSVIGSTSEVNDIDEFEREWGLRRQ